MLLLHLIARPLTIGQADMTYVTVPYRGHTSIGLFIAMYDLYLIDRTLPTFGWRMKGICGIHRKSNYRFPHRNCIFLESRRLNLPLGLVKDPVYGPKAAPGVNVVFPCVELRVPVGGSCEQ